ncbi:ABC transporter permease [Bacillus sp. H-16]|uniref:ABC transporter permease n=1 Tax=Alteribacter salitolerans TaxID=2912333 RepID=UPI0019666087|nr:ABC transporter permease [Alteribacter salitolerans]MBM7097786.1 ABC transporter permease [Alteribacter salitolerans]
MNNVQELWSSRRAEYWGMAIKYLRLIGNSGFLFTIYLLFIFGSYYYGEFLMWLPEDFPVVWVFILLFTWLVTRGRVRTFVRDADLVYLPPLESRMKPYFRSSILYSWMMETFWLALPMLILAPLFFHRLSDSGALLLTLLLLLSGLKLWNLATGFEEQRFQESGKVIIHTLLRTVINFSAVVALFSFQPVWIVAGLAGTLIVLYVLYFNKVNKTHAVKWDRLAEIEDRTVMTFYRVANSFTDVPQLKKTIRPRAYLNALFGGIKYNQKNTYLYMYSRSFVRSNDYFGIFVRLTLLGSLFLSIVTLSWGIWLIGVLFIYMTGIQLKTLKAHFKTNQMIDLYPAAIKNKSRAHVTLMNILLAFQVIVFFGVTMAAHGPKEAVPVLIATGLLAFLYPNVLLKKQQDAVQ